MGRSRGRRGPAQTEAPLRICDPQLTKENAAPSGGAVIPRLGGYE